MLGITYTTVGFFILSLLGHALYTTWKTKKSLHILQLNGYFNSRYFKWLNTRKVQVFAISELEPLLALVGVFFQIPLMVLVLFTIIYFRLFLLGSDKLQKKPLVFTPRATRLFIANIVLLLVLYSAIGWTWWYKGDVWLEIVITLLVVYSFFEPVIMALLNFLLLPLEKLIQSYYFKDAYRYLQTLTKLKIIGITGSFGKTSTKYILTEILRHKFNTLKTPGSFNTTMGVTKVIRMELKPIHDIFVVEMSAKKPGDIKEICQLVNPQYGLITAIGEQHLETFKNLENIIKTKGELIDSLPQDGVAFLNMDDEHCRKIASTAKCKVVGYGIDAKDLDYLVTDINLDELGSSFTVTKAADGEKFLFHTKLLGTHNICNILSAITVAAELGMKFSEMDHPIRQLTPIPHRLELKKVGGEVVFIDDAFNSNPVGSKSALEVLAKITGVRKIIVTPGLIELGDKEDEYNHRFGEQIAEVCDYVILVGKKQTSAIQKGLDSKQYPTDKLFVAIDFAEAKAHLETILEKGDVVLFENDLPDNYNEPGV